MMEAKELERTQELQGVTTQLSDQVQALTKSVEEKCTLILLVLESQQKMRQLQVRLHLDVAAAHAYIPLIM